MGEECYRIVLARLVKRSVACAIRSNGNAEADAYLNALNLSEKAKFLAFFRRIAETGLLKSSQYKKLKDEEAISEFLTRNHRILCFNDGHCIVLTHGFAKSGQKTPKTDTGRAKVIRAEYFEVKRECEKDKGAR